MKEKKSHETFMIKAISYISFLNFSCFTIWLYEIEISLTHHTLFSTFFFFVIIFSFFNSLFAPWIGATFMTTWMAVFSKNGRNFNPQFTITRPNVLKNCWALTTFTNSNYVINFHTVHHKKSPYFFINKTVYTKNKITENNFRASRSFTACLQFTRHLYTFFKNFYSINNIQ